MLERIVHGATHKVGAKPKASKRKDRIDWIALQGLARPVLDSQDDRLKLANFISQRMRDTWDRRRLFMFGDVLTLVEGDKTVEVSQRTFVHLVNQVSKPMTVTRDGELADSEFSTATLHMAWDISDRTFAHLDGITRVPFLRDDGSVCLDAGYDQASTMLLVPSEGLEAVSVPDEPSDSEVASAVKLLLDDWLGDFPFHTQADRANALALVLTPFIRGRLPRVPLAVLDGAHAGVGKGLLASCVMLLAVGEEIDPVVLPETSTEAWKTIHSLAGEGKEFLLLDSSPTS